MGDISDKLLKARGLKSIKDFIVPGLKCKINVRGTVYDGIIEEVTEDAIILAEHCVSAALCKVIMKDHISAIEFREEYKSDMTVQQLLLQQEEF